MTTSIQQLQTAQALAAAHGHHWADFPLDDLYLPANMLEVSTTIAKWAEADRPDWPGITPGWDVEGNMRHTTGSGRLEWCVDPKGNAELRVWRPNHELVISARVEYGPNITRLEVFHGARLRHWTALMDALSFLIDTDHLPACPPQILEAEARDVAEMMARVIEGMSHLRAAGGGRALAEALVAYGEWEMGRDGGAP